MLTNLTPRIMELFSLSSNCAARGGDDNDYSDMHHVAIDDYVLDVLMPDLAGHEHSPSAFLVYLALWTGLFRAEERAISISLGQLSTQTGLSKSAIQASLRILKRRG